MKAFRIIAAAILIAPSPVAAKELFDVYECSFKVSSHQFLSERVTLFVSKETDTLLVIDGFVHFTHGEPIPAELESETSKKIAVRWSVQYPDGHGNTARLSFRLSYFKGNKTANLSGKAMGYANQDNARGGCTVRELRL